MLVLTDVGGILIIGNGLIAQALREIDEDAVVFFASGVSDSQCQDIFEFAREKELVQIALNESIDRRFYYFSTCSVYDTMAKSTPYVQHKEAIERLVLEFPNSLVVRLPNVVGPRGNSNNLVNYFVNHIKNGTEFILQENARRYLLGTEEFKGLVAALNSQSTFSRIVNLVPPRSTSVRELVEILEEELGKRANALSVSGGSEYEVPGSDSSRLAQMAGIKFPDDYTKKLVRKLVLHGN